MTTQEYLGFNPKLEASYLDSLDKDIELRKTVLESEVTTAVQEAFLNKFERKYAFRDGKIFDDETKKTVEETVLRCDRAPEIEAINKIQDGLDKGRKMMVHFSAANPEYDYPANCVDFWWKNEDEVKWLRVVVENDFTDLKDVYTDLGGEKEIGNVMELLAEPVGVDEMNIGEVLEMLDLVKEINSITDTEIRESVQTLMRGFTEKFGEEITSNPNIIFRLFSAAIAEAKRINESDDEEYYDDEEENMWNYLNATMQTRAMETSGCASVTNVGAFESGTQMYLLDNGYGGLTIINGEAPDGYKLCKHCGLYYLGDKCPICD